ncbi:centrosomal protein kizuna isoform X1 [Anguilla anguilla]|uniref:centrosomal protein kizuna isoform X1 n=1 Tax=Anguilla anguilla TaxID=7936 RepID=UPI0015ABFA64|nr:centrosomal protein kizuna isoform X1 [Anguilla anguilla]
MAFCDKEYFEKIGELQQNMHKSEKRRFQLERELLAICTSGKQGSEMKNTKLRCYLKQICERENRAKARNLELLRNMEIIEFNMKALCSNHSALRQKKQIEMQGKALQGSTASDRSPHLAKGLYQPAAIFMSHHTSRSLPVEAECTKEASVQQSSVEHDGLARRPEQSESGTSKNPRLSRKGTGGPPRSPDDASAVGDVPARRDASGGDAGTVARAPPSLDIASLAPGPHVIPEQLSPRAALTASEREAPPAVGAGREGARTPPAESLPGGLSNDGAAEGGGESTSRACSPEFGSGEKRQDALDSESLPSRSTERSADLTLSSGSDLPPSLSEGRDPGGLREGTALPSARSLKTSRPEGAADGSDELVAAGYHAADARQESQVTGESQVGRESWRGKTKSASKATAPMLSLEGFFHLLECIEERLDEREKEVYRISSVSEQHLSYLISLCNGNAALNDEDLEACGAVALHQLQRLSWNTSKGCLLPREVVSASWTVAAEEGRIRSCLSADGARLWDRWFRHAVALRDRGALAADGIAKLFAPLLVEKGASYADKAEALLSVMLEEAGGDAASVDSDESSGGLPSLLFDGGEIKAARPAGWHETYAHGQQSGEEDSREESFVESIPIRETKAYQLLKQSATQRRPQSPPEDEDELDAFPSGVTHNHHMENSGKDDRTRTSSSSFSERPLVGAGKVAKSAVPAVQSKAFWGESDDSNSEIEAALRPQSHGPAVDDFDYFDD